MPGGTTHMTEYVGQSQLPHAVLSMTTLIDRHADRYTTDILKFLNQNHDDPARTPEKLMLRAFHNHVENLVLDYDSAPIAPGGDTLIFRHIYEAAELPIGHREQPGWTPLTILTALLAAEVEFRGPRRLSRTQNMRLAEIYEQLGHRLTDADLPSHAALAFKRATALHALEEDFGKQDRCRLALARARRRATFPVWKRIPGAISDLLCGYGFRPFQLLGWIALQLLAFTAALWLTDREPISTTFHLCLVNYLNPVGLGDLTDIGRAGRVLLIVESYTGIVFTSVFFALLVRRWFRL
ncbi:hypothetical protein FB390_2588 [Nocardia bhagyanarayanae]|uniref:Ion channel n=2 Tax=Nocardia bhagyanarayanae TaxID=1215925 RepID=A0A543FAY0_9NOCA|nr:hypothetical protein FB390_2588 [Nocardia bhagyanarayanae]